MLRYTFIACLVPVSYIFTTFWGNRLDRRTNIQIDETRLALRYINRYVYCKYLSAERMEKEMAMAYIMYRFSICLERGGFWPGFRTPPPLEYKASVPVTTPRSSMMCGATALFKFDSVVDCCRSCEILGFSDQRIEILSTTIKVVKPPLLPTGYLALKYRIFSLDLRLKKITAENVPLSLNSWRQ